MTETFPELSKKVCGRDLLVFFDFESTGFSHQAIALGTIAYSPLCEDSLSLGKKAFSFRRLIRPKEKIGPVVESLTGLSDELVQREGLPLGTVLKEWIDLLRPFSNKLFLSYSGMDLAILSNSIGDSLMEEQFYAHVKNNYLDFKKYLDRFLCDEHGQSLSLLSLAKRFSVTLEGTPHDPLTESLTLAGVYENVVSDEEQFLRECLLDYPNNRHLSFLERKLILEVARGKTLTFEQFKENLRRCF